MTIEHLRAFVALAEERSFVRAAGRMYMSTSPFSRRIRELEELAARQLFVRTTRRVELSEAGAELLPQARAVLTDFDGLLPADSGARDGARRTISIGFPLGGINRVHRTAVLRTVEQAVPGAACRLRSGHPRDLCGLLAAGELDLAVLTSADEAAPFESVLVGEDDYSVAFSASDPLAAHDAVRLEQLRHQRFVHIEISPPTGSLRALQRLVLAAGIATEPLVVTDMPSACAVLATGGGFTLAPLDDGPLSRALYDDPDIAVLGLIDFERRRPALVAWSLKHTAGDPTRTAIAAELMQTFGSPAVVGE